MNIETILIDLLEPDPRNARKHDKRNLDTIAASLREFGQRKHIIRTTMVAQRTQSGRQGRAND